MAKTAFNNRKELVTSKLKITTKKQLVNTLVWNVLLYGAETMTLRKRDIKRPESMEMRIW